MITIKENAKTLKIKEHTIWEDSCGLTIEFIVNENTPECPYRIKLYGDVLKFGNRQLEFGLDGINNGGGTCLQEACSHIS